jgi:hypothetical protein
MKKFKIRRILITGAAVITMAVSLSGCGSTTTDTTETVPDVEDRFMEIRTNDGPLGTYTYIYVDKETGVMYLFVKDGYGGGLTVMVDEEGKPLIWEQE